jgi:hypothetical protein
VIKHWILDTRGRPFEVDLMTWGLWFEDARNQIQFATEVGHVRVSTIFLGIDHGFGMSATPILWETMALADGVDDLPQYRCGGSRDQAEEQHRRVVREVAAALGVPEEEAKEVSIE